jgi:hypothetical protein
MPVASLIATPILRSPASKQTLRPTPYNLRTAKNDSRIPPSRLRRFGETAFA